MPVSGAPSSGRLARAQTRARSRGLAARPRRNRDSGRTRADFHNAIDRPEIGHRHGAIGHEQRLDEPADLDREDSAGGGGMRRARVSRTDARLCFSVTPQFDRNHEDRKAAIPVLDDQFYRSYLRRRASRRVCCAGSNSPAPSRRGQPKSCISRSSRISISDGPGIGLGQRLTQSIASSRSLTFQIQ